MEHWFDRPGAIAGASGMLNKSRLAEQAMGMAETQTRSPGLPEALKRLSHCNEELHSVLMTLTERLEPMLLPPSDVGNGSAKPPEPVRSSMAYSIHGEADRVYGATLTLRELLSPLDT